MPKSAHPGSLLAADAFEKLHKSRQQVLDAATGKLPERLLAETVATVMCLTRKQRMPGLSKKVFRLVRQSLKAIARKQWKPETALLLGRRTGEGGHGPSS